MLSRMEDRLAIAGECIKFVTYLVGIVVMFGVPFVGAVEELILILCLVVGR